MRERENSNARPISGGRYSPIAFGTDGRCLRLWRYWTERSACSLRKSLSLGAFRR